MPGKAKALPGAATVFGYSIQSPLSFAFLRNGGGDGPLHIRVDEAVDQPSGSALLEWLPRPDHPRGARLYEMGSQYRVWIDQGGWFQIDHRQAAIAVSPSAEPLRREASLWGLPSALCFMGRGDLPLHAAALDVDGSAILLAAPGGAGKTTLACGFLRAGYRVLAEDLSCCRAASPSLLLPGPAILRMRRDTYEHLELTETRVVAEDPDRIVLAQEPSVRGDGRAVPIGAIVLLGPGNASPAFERVALPDAIRALWSLSFMLPRDADRAQSFQAVTAMASAVPVWTLRWRRSFSELPQVVNAIVSTCRS
jgi:hypothetical protein